MSDQLTVPPRQSFAAEVTNFPVSLAAGVVGVRVIHLATGLEVIPRTSAVTEDPPASDSYIAVLTAPALQGVYSIFWDWCDGGPLIPSRTATQTLIVAIPAGATGEIQRTPPTVGPAAVRVPHFSMPFRFLAGAAAVNEQDTIEEIGDCVANICRYTVGDRPDKPAFGIPEVVFAEGGPDAGVLAAAVAGQEPRAHLAASADGSSLEQLVAKVAVTVTDKGDTP